MNRLYLIGGAVSGVAVVAVGLGLTGAMGSADPLIPFEDARAVASGEALYAAHCAACHGANLEGEADWRARDAEGYLPAPPHDASGHTWHHPDAVLFEITKYGTEAVIGNGYRSRMMGFADVLTDTEIAATLAYIKSTWPPRVVEMHNDINAGSR